MNIIRHWRNANLKLNDIPLHPYWNFHKNNSYLLTANEDVKQLYFCETLLMGMQNLTTTLENSLVVCYKVKYAFTT